MPDRFWFEILSRKGSQLTERNGLRGSPHTSPPVGLYPTPGSSLDWLYGQGILSWTPEVYAASSLAFARRLTTTNVFTVATSLGIAFNPPPESIPLTVDRWLQWNLYLLAATPTVALTGVWVDGDGLRLAIANDCLLPLDVTVSTELGSGAHFRVLAQLRAEQRTVTVPLPDAPYPQLARVVLQGVSPTGAGAGRRQTQVVELEIQPNAVQVLSGQLAPFADLGEFFGGWFAQDRWDEPAVYHLGPPLLRAQFLPILVRGQ